MVFMRALRVGSKGFVLRDPLTHCALLCRGGWQTACVGYPSSLRAGAGARWETSGGGAEIDEENGTEGSQWHSRAAREGEVERDGFPAAGSTTRPEGAGRGSGRGGHRLWGRQSEGGSTAGDQLLPEWTPGPAKGAGRVPTSVSPGLYLVGTPIGNLEDVSLRALRVLSQAELVLAEDTRHTLRLFRHYGIQTPLLSYHKFNTSARLATVLQRLQSGASIALVSDAGMPAISDPGAEIVSACAAAGVPVVPVPGPSAVVTAVAVAGFSRSTSFTFLGFPPEKATKRVKLFQEAARHVETQVLFVAPHKLLSTLLSCKETFGMTRRCVVARELTKLHEELWRGTLGAALEAFEVRTIKGEITLVIEGADSRTDTLDSDSGQTEAELEERICTSLSLGLSVSATAKAVSQATGSNRAEVYARTLEAQQRLGLGPTDGLEE